MAGILSTGAVPGVVREQKPLSHVPSSRAGRRHPHTEQGWGGSNARPCLSSLKPAAFPGAWLHPRSQQTLQALDARGVQFTPTGGFPRGENQAAAELGTSDTRRQHLPAWRGPVLETGMGLYSLLEIPRESGTPIYPSHGSTAPCAFPSLRYGFSPHVPYRSGAQFSQQGHAPSASLTWSECRRAQHAGLGRKEAASSSKAEGAF